MKVESDDFPSFQVDLENLNIVDLSHKATYYSVFLFGTLFIAMGVTLRQLKQVALNP